MVKIHSKRKFRKGERPHNNNTRDRMWYLENVADSPSMKNQYIQIDPEAAYQLFVKNSDDEGLLMIAQNEEVDENVRRNAQMQADSLVDRHYKPMPEPELGSSKKSNYDISNLVFGHGTPGISALKPTGTGQKKYDGFRWQFD